MASAEVEALYNRLAELRATADAATGGRKEWYTEEADRVAERINAIEAKDGPREAGRSTIKTGKKILRFRPTSKSGMELHDERAVVAGSAKKHIVSDAKAGNFLTGPTSIMADVRQIRVAGLWTLRPTLPSTVASTIVTPHPALELNIPYNNASIFQSVLKLFKDALA
ncbi:MAG: hypothetical protein GQ553_01235 [Nitrosomonadaceae bacterium]|nr:hypothetical protein [Nitrosomonadaceae bacterium]